MCDDPTKGLPDDLASVLRDTSIIVSQDAAVFDAIARWRNAPSDTASTTNAERSPDSDLSVRLAEAESLVATLTGERDEPQSWREDRWRNKCAAAAAQVAVLRHALEQAADKLDVIRRCTINSRTAPNVLDTVADVSLWARDDAREALAAAVVVGQPDEVSEPGATSSAENTQPGGSGADHTAKAGDAEAELVTSQTEGMANSAAPGSLTSPVVGQPGESPAETGDAQSGDEQT